MVQLPGDFFLDFLGFLINRAGFICLHALKVSLLLFNSAKSGLNKM